MASDASRSVYRALAVNDAEVELWDDETSVTGLAPIPGVPEPDQVTALVLDASGDQTSGGHLRVVTLHAGLPEVDGARFAWRHDTDADTDWRGWEPPATISGYESVRAAGSGTLVSCGAPHALGLPDGTVVAVYQTDDSGRAPADDGIEVSVRSPSTGTWSTVLVYSTTFAPPTGQAYHPCLLRLPDGRLQAYHWVFDPTSGAAGNANVRMWYSDDQGATWTLGASYVLRADVAYNGAAPGTGVAGYLVGRLRCAYFEGQVVLVAHLQALDTDLTHRDTLAQWHSSDDGTSFKLVGIWDSDTSTGGGSLPEVIATDFGLVLVFLGTSDRKPRARRIAAAAYSFESALEYEVADASEAWATVSTTGSSDLLSEGDLAACMDETGAIYVWGRQPTVAGEGVVVRSDDGGESWTHLGQGSSTSGWSMWWQANDTATHPAELSVAAAQGRLVMVSRFDADPGTADLSIVALYLGGYSTMTLPGYTRFGQETRRVSWERTWVPFDLPGSTYWTAAGAGTQALTSNVLVVTTTAGQTRSYSRVPLGTVDEGMIVEVAFTVSSGGSLATLACGVLLRLDDGAEGYVVSVRAAGAGWRLYDHVAGTQIGSDVTAAPPSAGVVIRVALGKDADGNGAVATWYRALSRTDDREWSVGPTSSALTDNAGAGGANSIQWAHISASASTSSWHWVFDVSDQWAGRTRLCEGQTNPNDLLGRAYSPRGVYVTDGLVLRAVDGPTRRGDLWSIVADDEAPLARVLAHGAHPSPRIAAQWDADVQADIALRWSSIGDSRLGSDSIAVALLGSTIGRVQIDGYDADTSSWVTLTTVDLFDGMEALPFTRGGNSVRPGSSAPTDSPTLLYGEAVGWYAWHYSGGHYAWEVLENTEGKWTNATTRRPVLRVDAASTDPSSGTLHLVPSRVLLVLHTNGALYSALRLRVPAASSTIPRPPGGVHRLGTVLLGPIAAMPEDYSWGRVIEADVPAEIVTQADGTKTSRSRAPLARVVEIGWQGGVETRAAQTSTHDADPDYLLLSARASATPAALKGTTPTVLEGVLERVAGEHGLVAYVPRLTKGGDSDVVTLYTRREQFLVGRLRGPIRRESVVGDEFNELVRVASVTVIEET